jgi:hypothetical protein
VPNPTRFPSAPQIATPVRIKIRHFPGGAQLELHFRARIAARSVQTGYAVELDVPLSANCGGGGYAGVNRDVAAGQVVQLTLPLNPRNCPGRYRGRVYYATAATSGPPLLPNFSGPTVGRFTFRLP